MHAGTQHSPGLALAHTPRHPCVPPPAPVSAPSVLQTTHPARSWAPSWCSHSCRGL